VYGFGKHQIIANNRTYLANAFGKNTPDSLASIESVHLLTLKTENAAISTEANTDVNEQSKMQISKPSKQKPTLSTARVDLYPPITSFYNMCVLGKCFLSKGTLLIQP